MEQVTGIEPATISLATRSSTAELHLHGAGSEIRTHDKRLETFCVATTPYPHGALYPGRTDDILITKQVLYRLS